MTSATTQLDHIILLLSPLDFNHVPSWLADNFHIIEGGTHSKGTSHNKLIIFKDGTYLELFSWVDPQPEGVEPYADFPSWADKPEGYIIDWALTGPDAQGKYEEISSRIRDLPSVSFEYNEPTAGGRKRMDGKELKWVTTRTRSFDRATPNVPFFCHDVSDRVLRVPHKDERTGESGDITNHPCGAIGISGVTIEVPADQLEAYAKLYQAILGSQGVGKPDGVYEITLAAPDKVQIQRSEVSSEPSLFAASECLVRLVPTVSPSAEPQMLALLTNDINRTGEQLVPVNQGTPVYLF